MSVVSLWGTKCTDPHEGDGDILTAAAAGGCAVLLISHTPVPDELITTRVALAST